MTKHKISFPALFLATFLSVTFISCDNNSGNIPFPEKELGFSQPVSIPLQFSEGKKLNWDTAKQGGIKPVIKKLDIQALPSKPFDTSGFRPFIKPPEEISFDFNSLPESTLDLDSLPSKPLQFKTTIFDPPANVKALTPVVQKGKAISIADFGPLQGLPAKFVSCLLKDKNGLMWIAGNEGLFRYDGSYIQTYIHGSNAAPIVGMTEDNQGNIWFIRNGGIGMIDLRRGTINYSPKISAVFNNLAKMTKDGNGLIWVYNKIDSAVSIVNPEARTYKSLDTKNGLSDRAAFETLEDDNKNIWISTYTSGVDVFNPTTGKIKHLKKINGLNSDTLTAMTKGKDGHIWLTDSKGELNEIDIKQGTIRHYNSYQRPKNNYTFNLAFDNRNRLWVGSNQGLIIVDQGKGMSRFINQNHGLADKLVTACVPDANNRMWVATIQGMHIISQNGETVHPLGATIVITQMEDAESNIWIGTNNGISLINKQKNAMRVLDKSHGLSDDLVQSFAKVNQQIWVTSNGGLDIIDPVQKTLEHTGKKEGLVSDTIYSVFKDKAGNTWLTGPSNGVDLIDSAKKIIRHADAISGLSDNNIQDVKQDKDGLIWLATNSGGINIFNSITGTVKYLNKQPGLKDPCDKMMLLDKYDRIWIGTDKGILIVDKKLSTITQVTTKEGLSGNKVLSLLEYNESVIAGTNNKATIITAPVPSYATTDKASADQDLIAVGWKIAPLDQSELLLREQTNAWSTDLVTKNGQYLWGDRGITTINEIKPENDSVATFITGMNIMTRPQHFVNTVKAGEKDTLWAADTFYVKGQKPVGNAYSLIKGLRMDSVTGPYNLPVNLEIPHDNNYMQFQFGQAHLSRLDTTWYSYMLAGIDKNWSLATVNLVTENYLNLPPGKYTFKVSSKGINGRWSRPATLDFTILPPWYQTWWAYILYVLTGIGIIRAYIVYRSRRLKKENRILEEKIDLRTNQLQKSLEDLKATQAQLIQSEKMASLGELTAGIAHEIQNPLNFINNFSEVNTELISEMKEEIEKGNLEEVKAIADDIAANEQKINHHGKRADGIVKGMLQHSRSGNRQKEPTNINALADEYLRLAYHGLRAKDKSFNAIMKTDFDETIGDINVIPQDIGRVVLNLITNAFYAVTEKKKQTSSPLPTAEGIGNPQDVFEPTVSVSTKKSNGKVQVIVKDNGNGIPQKVLEKIFQPFFTTKPTGEGTGLGLSLSYDIIKAHNGELKVETKEGEGATFIIILP
ncbi:MAG: two-component regulator propeller domain-containing protein [Chitinophagaceae bacterium]